MTKHSLHYTPNIEWQSKTNIGRWVIFSIDTRSFSALLRPMDGYLRDFIRIAQVGVGRPRGCRKYAAEKPQNLNLSINYEDRTYQNVRIFFLTIQC